jgi:hypothetical protein
MNISPPSSGLKSKSSKKQATGKLSLPPACAGSFLGLLLNPEDEGDMFIQNVRLSPNYAVLQRKRLYSSQMKFFLQDAFHLVTKLYIVEPR